MNSESAKQIPEARAKRIIRLAYLLPMGIMALIAAGLAFLVSHLLSIEYWVDHTDQVIAQAQRCEKLVIDMQSGLRGYLLSGDMAFLGSFEAPQNEVAPDLARLSNLVSDNPPQVQRIEIISRDVEKWIVYAKDLRARREHGGDYQSASLHTAGLKMMNNIHDGFSDFIAVESKLRNSRLVTVQDLDRDIRGLRWILLPITGLALGVFSAWQLKRVAAIYESALQTAETKTRELELSESSLRHAEACLKQYAEQLEKMVEQRTAKLKETVGELEAYSYSISHDLRAPLRAMEGYARILNEDFKDKLGADGRAFLDRIIQAAHRMDRLIQDVLCYSRLSRAEIQCDQVDLDRMLQEILEHYPNFKDLDGEIQIERPLPRISAPEALLNQCIANLLHNAVKFVPPNTKPHIVIRAETNDKDVRIWVEDNGIGISPEYQEKIFGVFERVAENSHYEGTGIGLAIVKKAMERMGGSAGVKSSPGQGSRFWLFLPGKKL